MGSLGKSFWLISIVGVGAIGIGSYGLVNYFSKGDLVHHIYKSGNKERCNVLTRNNNDSWEELSEEKCSKLIKESSDVFPESNKPFYWVRSSNQEYLKNALLWSELISKSSLRDGRQLPDMWINGPAECKKQGISEKTNRINILCRINDSRVAQEEEWSKRLSQLKKLNEFQES